MTTTQTIRPVQCTVTVLRAPITEAVRTSFGTMRDRPAVLVAITDASGLTGYGECWCNFPSCGAEHRARLLHSEIAPLLVGRNIDDPRDFFHHITRSLHLLALQSAEHGPVAQAIAAVDIALWDLYAQLAQVPLYQLLHEQTRQSQRPDAQIKLYASGLNPDNPTRMVERKWHEGYRAFKLKVGFDAELDIQNAAAIRSTIGDDAALMLDANQAWSMDQAVPMLSRFEPHRPVWIEEPLAADAPLTDWQALAKSTPLALAAGENLRGLDEFQSAIDCGAFGYLQPDVAKWGGISGCIEVARQATGNGLIYCPHWLGAAVGLIASAHLLAAVGGAGMLEVDANANPLRDELIERHRDPQLSGQARWQPGDEPGLGISLRADTLAQYRVAEWTVK